MEKSSSPSSQSEETRSDSESRQTDPSPSTEPKYKTSSTNKPEDDSNARYECDKCGACCTQLIVEISHIDVVREPRLREASKLMRQTPDWESDWDNEYLLACGYPCPMLGTDKLCQIYPSRPNTCVAFKAGNEQCQMAREDAGLPPLQPIKP